MTGYGRKVLLTGFDTEDKDIFLLLQNLTAGLTSDPRNIGVVPTHAPSEEEFSRALRDNDLGLAAVAYDSGWIRTYNQYQQVLSRLAEVNIPVLLFYREADTGIVQSLRERARIDDLIHMPARFKPTLQGSSQGSHFIEGAIKAIREMVHTEIQLDYTRLGFIGPGDIGEHFLHRAAESILREQIRPPNGFKTYYLYVAGKDQERTERIVESLRQYLGDQGQRLATTGRNPPVIRIKSSNLEEIAASCSVTFDTAGNYKRESALFKKAQERKRRIHRDSLLAVTLPGLMERAKAFRYAPGRVIVFTNPVNGALCAYVGEALRGVSDEEEIKRVMDRFEGSVAVDHLRGVRILEGWAEQLLDLREGHQRRIDLRLMGMHGDDFIITKANIQGAKLESIVETRLEELEFQKNHAPEEERRALEQMQEDIRSMTTERLKKLVIERGIGPHAVKDGRLVGEAAAALQTHFLAIMTQDPQSLPVMRFTDLCEYSTIDCGIKVKVPGKKEPEEIGTYLRDSFLLGCAPMATYRTHEVFPGIQERIDITAGEQLENLVRYLSSFRRRFIREMRKKRNEEGLDVSHLLRLFNDA